MTPSWRSGTPIIGTSPGTTEWATKPVTAFPAWKMAARPHTLPAAVVPVLVGSGLAYGEGVFRWDAFLWALVAALAIQIAANFANDASDAARGVDTEDRLGPPRMVALGVISPKRMWLATWLAIGIGGVAAVFLTVIAGWVVLVIGAASVVAMLGYVGGPLPYGYRGMGEVFVFLFFGLAATVGSRFVHDGLATMEAWLLAIPVGLLVTAILVVNNLRDIDTDASTGKRTLAVIMGRQRTRILFMALVYTALGLVAIFGTAGWVPRSTLFAGFLLPYATVPVRIVFSRDDGPSLIRALKATARLHLWFGVVVAAAAAFAP